MYIYHYVICKRLILSESVFVPRPVPLLHQSKERELRPLLNAKHLLPKLLKLQKQRRRCKRSKRALRSPNFPLLRAMERLANLRSERKVGKR